MLNALPYSHGGDLLIDATQTHTITTPGLQILLAFGCALQQVRGQFFLREKDATISRAFAEAGIELPFTGV